MKNPNQSIHTHMGEAMDLENCTTPIIDEATETNQTSSAVRKQWSELQPELLSKIAVGLGLIELLGFRGVCKAWNSAASFASAEIESSRKPWFLLYGESSQCRLLTNEWKHYTINISELEGATCLASLAGWLLIFRHGNMFFFCPFSLARIDIPEFPQSNLSDHVAAFSSAPTSQDCVVAVISRSNESSIELNIIKRGESGWTKLKPHFPSCKLKTVKAALYLGCLRLVDDQNQLVTFTPEEKVFYSYPVPYESKPKSSRHHLIRLRPSSTKEFVEELEVGREYSYNINTCGTLTKSDELYINERELQTDKQDAPVVFAKGVWLQPRFHQISEGQSWSL